MAPARASQSIGGPSLKESLEGVLPVGVNYKVRYVHTPSKPCDPLFSAMPGLEPEKTRLASHFLTVSVNSEPLLPSTADHKEHDVIGFAVEVLLYTSRYLTTIFVSKVDSTSYIPRENPSPIKTTITTFLRWLADEERQRHPRRKIVISLFARAQAQYLFPGSSDSNSKHVLDDRQLIKWWAKVLDPIFPSASLDALAKAEYQGYLTVPGYAGNELRSFMPPSAAGESSNPHWKSGNPLVELASTRGLPEHAPPRCLLPRFPDDPKSRFIEDLDDEIGISQDSQVTFSPSKRKTGMWNSVRDLERFWEAMEFRQECASGRVVGFLWLVISPIADDEEADANGLAAASNGSQESPPSPSARTAKPRQLKGRANTQKPRNPLSGPVVARQPRLKGSSLGAHGTHNATAQASPNNEIGVTIKKDWYDKAMQTLLNLDFSTREVAARSTAKWVAEVAGLCGLRGDFGVQIVGSVKAPDRAKTQAEQSSGTAVNDLGGMVRKKRKATVGSNPETPASNALNSGSSNDVPPAVTVLSGGLIRKKPKPAAE